MEASVQAAGPRRKRRIRPHWIAAILLLLIPLSAAVYCVVPSYYSYTALGETVSVRDIGVQGSVRFVYVREGVTRNFFERMSVRQTFPDAVFEKADPDIEDDFDESVEIGEELRNETIAHAIDQAADEAGTPLDEDVRGERLNRLIEETSDYYGDSIGLMLGIGLVEEARHADYSAYGTRIIAGTGTLEEDHSVGSVGAIRNKLRTAEKDGAEIFFVPKDRETFLYEGPSNEEEAQQAAQELHLRLRVVPVATLEEAIDYLDRLPGIPLVEER